MGKNSSVEPHYLIVIIPFPNDLFTARPFPLL